MATEEERASAYRATVAARAKAVRAREKALAGDSAARKALHRAWEPLRGLLGTARRRRWQS